MAGRSPQLVQSQRPLRQPRAELSPFPCERGRIQPVNLQVWSARLERCRPAFLGLLACLLAAPALAAGLVGDDYFHRMILLHRGELAPFLRPVTDLFTFVKQGDGAEVMRGLGYLPWWSDPGLHISLFRPITALTHMLDYTLWPDNFALQHLHSLGWSFAGVVLVACLYRTVPGMSMAAAGLAGLLFAVEDAHALPSAWLANRNALLCLVSGATTLILHIRWRLTGRRHWLVLALSAFTAGLLCGEATIGVLGYLVAWHLTMEQDRPRFRSLAVVSYYVGVVCLWRLLYGTLGYGTSGSLLYVDPGQTPFLFLQVLAERWPILIAGQWLQLPIDVWIILSRDKQVIFSLASAVLAAAMFLLFRPALKRPVARFWAIGMGLCLVPVCAAFPMERLLVLGGIGAFGLLALFVESYLVSPSASAPWRRRAAITLLLFHVPIAAIFLTVGSIGLPAFGEFFLLAAKESPTGPEITQQTFIYVNGNDFPVFYGRVVRVVNRAQAPRRIAQLASMLDGNRVYRQDLSTLVVTPDNGFFAAPLDRLLVSDNRFRQGIRIDRPDYQAEILSITQDGRPAVVSFRFHRPLEQTSLRWLCWKDGRLQEFPLPNVGDSILLPRIKLEF